MASFAGGRRSSGGARRLSKAEDMARRSRESFDAALLDDLAMTIDGDMDMKDVYESLRQGRTSAGIDGGSFMGSGGGSFMGSGGGSFTGPNNTSRAPSFRDETSMASLGRLSMSRLHSYGEGMGQASFLDSNMNLSDVINSIPEAVFAEDTKKFDMSALAVALDSTDSLARFKTFALDSDSADKGSNSIRKKVSLGKKKQQTKGYNGEAARQAMPPPSQPPPADVPSDAIKEGTTSRKKAKTNDPVSDPHDNFKYTSEAAGKDSVKIVPFEDGKYKPKVAKGKNYLNLRKGKWSSEEGVYFDILLEYFTTGMFDIPVNYPLRIFLAHCLGCGTMRISKKFVGDKQIGKQRYAPLPYSALACKSDEEMQVAAARIDDAQAGFKKHLKASIRGKHPDYKNITTKDVRSRILWPRVLMPTGSGRRRSRGSRRRSSARSSQGSSQGSVNAGSLDNVSFDEGVIGDLDGFNMDDLEDLAAGDHGSSFDMASVPAAETYQSTNMSAENMIIVETRDPSKYTVGDYFENSQIVGKILHISLENKEMIVHVEKNKSGKGLTAKRFRD